MRWIYVGILVIIMTCVGNIRLHAESKVIFKGVAPPSSEVVLRWSNQVNRIASAGLALEGDLLLCQQSGLTVHDIETGSTVVLSLSEEEFCWTKSGREIVQLIHLGTIGGSRFFLINSDSGAMEPLLTLANGFC